MNRNLLVGMGAVIGLLTCPAASQAQGPDVSKATIVATMGTNAGGSNIGQYYGGNPAYFIGTRYPGDTSSLMIVNQSGVGTTNTINPFVVKIVNSGATFQQVLLTAKGTVYNRPPGAAPYGPFIPVQLQIFITLTSKPSPVNYNGPTRVATMTYKAFNSTGLVFNSGPLTGFWK